MSLMKKLEVFIADNPGLTSREIAEAFASHSVDSVQRTVCRLHDFHFATRVMQGNQYRYYVVGAESGDRLHESKPKKDTSPLFSKAKALMAKGMYRRAASVWFEAFRCSEGGAEREHCLKQRQRCLRNAKQPTSQCEWYLAGKFTGGHE